MKFPRISLSLLGIFCMLGVGQALTADHPIEDIMVKAMKKGGVRHQINLEINKPSPNWEAIQKKSKELTNYCGDLCNQTPPKGEPESWKKLTEALTTNVKSFNDYAGKKDEANAKLVLRKINESCNTCHKAHRE